MTFGVNDKQVKLTDSGNRVQFELRGRIEITDERNRRYKKLCDVDRKINKHPRENKHYEREQFNLHKAGIKFTQECTVMLRDARIGNIPRVKHTFREEHLEIN